MTHVRALEPCVHVITNECQGRGHKPCDCNTRHGLLTPPVMHWGANMYGIRVHADPALGYVLCKLHVTLGGQDQWMASQSAHDLTMYADVTTHRDRS